MAKPEDSPKQTKPKKAKNLPKWLKILLLIIVISILIALLALLWQQYQSGKKQKQDYEKQKQELQEKIKTLEEELQSEKDKLSELESAKKEESITFPSSLKENLEAVLATGNTQPIETYVTNPVTVILAASEAYGPVTPTKAAESIDYVIDAQQPWNCDLPAATLSAWEKGDYKQYFSGSATLACKSKDNKVVAFTVNKSGKITTMFMSASSDLLQ